MKFKIISLNNILILIYKAVLHLAVEKENKEIIRLLLKRNDIDTNIEDSQGRKPIDYSSNDEIRLLLS